MRIGMALVILLAACSAPRRNPLASPAPMTDAGAAPDGPDPGADGATTGQDPAADAISGGDSGASPLEVGSPADAPATDVPPGTPDVPVGEVGATSAPNGTPCSAGTACSSGRCVDGVCCESPCTGQCESCREDGNRGRCIAVSDAPRSPRPPCAGAGTACAGRCNGVATTACTFPGMEKECAAATCQSGTAHARAVCDGKGACPTPMTVSCGGMVCAGPICAGGCSAANPCTSDSYCSGGKCFPKQPLGAACSDAESCQSGRCVDGVCCDTACNGSCEACNLAGNGGRCSAVRSAEDAQCTGGKTCDASGACKSRAGADCAGNNDCATGSCVDNKCCTQSACGTCQACTGGGGICVAVTNADDDACSGTCDGSGLCKSKRGQVCGAGCIVGTYCSPDGLCCDQPCSASCMACNLPGSVGTCAPKSPTSCADAAVVADAGVDATVDSSPDAPISCGQPGQPCCQSNACDSSLAVCSGSTCIAKRAWAVGVSNFQGAIAEWNGSAWTSKPVPATGALLAIHGTTQQGDVDSWLVGSHGKAVHRDAAGTFNNHDLGLGVTLNGVWKFGPGAVWVVGGDESAGTSFLGRGGGASWTAGSLAEARWLQGIWAGGAGDIWAVGYDAAVTGLVMHWPNQLGTPSTRAVANSRRLNAIWGDGTGVWSVGTSDGDQGTVALLVHWPSGWSSTLTTTTIPGATMLVGIWGSGPRDVWAVGDDGARGIVVHWTDGPASTPTITPLIPAPAGQFAGRLSAIWGSGPRDIWVVGNAGGDAQAFHFNGTWSGSMPLGALERVYGIWGVAK